MSIIRITEGEHITEIEGKWTVFTDEFEAYAGKFSHFTAIENTVFGNPQVIEQKESNYFKEGWWSSDVEGNNIIGEARIGDRVYFNIITENIPNIDVDTRQASKINIQLFDYDGGWGNDPDLINIREINIDQITCEETLGELITEKIVVENKISYSLNLSEGLSSYIESDVGDEIELYFQCSYKEDLEIKLPKNESAYLKVLKTLFPLIVHHRSFAPWIRFGNFFFETYKNSFQGDNRGFSLAENFIESGDDTLISRNSKLRNSGKVTSRLYQKIEFDYNNDGLNADKTIAICNMTQGYQQFVSSSESYGIQTPDHFEYYGDHSIFGDEAQRGVVNISIWGSDPLIWPAPDIRWKLLVRLNLDLSKNILTVDGFVIGKGFPAYEAFIEDSVGNKIFLHAFMPSTELLIVSELDFTDIPDYTKAIKMEIDINLNSAGYSFGEKIIKGTFNSTNGEIEYNEILIADWNDLYLSIPISADVN